MNISSPQFVIDDLNELLNEKSSWNFTLESNSGIDPVLLKYNDCVTYLDCRTINPDVATDVDENGAWNYRLYNLETGGVYDAESDTDEGLFMIDGGNTSLVSFNVDLPNLTDGYRMFHSCSSLTSFNSDLPRMTNGGYMFYNCRNLTTFNGDLSNLTNGYLMFYHTALASFNGDLSSLTDGTRMFFKSTLESFTADLSSLTNGYLMFYVCPKLTSFNGDLSSLANGLSMFSECTKLTSFDSDLSNLTNGGWMFYDCKLNTASVQNIADTINTVSSGTIHIGIGNSTPNTEEETSFNTMVSKGWRVYVNGSKYTPTSPAAITTLDETGQETVTPIPFYAKPIQVTEDVAEYIDSNNNYYNVVGGQFIYGDDISTYGMFTSFEHAESEISIALGLTKYTKPAAEKQQHTLNALLMPNLI